MVLESDHARQIAIAHFFQECANAGIQFGRLCHTLYLEPYDMTVASKEALDLLESQITDRFFFHFGHEMIKEKTDESK